MKLLHSLLILLVVCFALSCSPLYIPNQPNVLLMSDGDETQIGMQVGSNGYGLQLGYSPYYHWVLAASGNVYSFVADSNFVIRDRHIYGEVATGYYTRLNRLGRLEILAGYGTGSTGLSNDRGLYNRVFFQPSIGISGPYVDMAFTPRVAWVNHFENRTPGGVVEQDQSSMYLEPFLTFRGGWEQIKFQLQTGYSFELGDPAYSHQGFVGSIGFNVVLFRDFDRYK
ncbi:MAG: hypothetical protein AAGN35_16420 [Bacteroidota bacterium]